MSINTPGGNDTLPPRPPSGGSGTGDARPGYPAPGQAERLAALQAREAATQTRDPSAALDAELAALEAGKETPSERTARLGVFVETHFADIVPEVYTEVASSECCRREDQLRELFDEPDLIMADEDADDPVLRQRVADVVAIATNDETIAALSADEDAETALLARQDTDLVPASAAERAALETAHPEVTVPRTEAERIAALSAAESQTESLRSHRDARSDVQDEVAEDLSTLEGVQARFNELRAEHGTVGALRMLLEGENALQNPELRAIVQRTINTAQSLVTALPGREDVVTRLLDASGLSLGASSSAATFSGFLSAVDSNTDLSDEEKATLRQVIGAQNSPRNATELQNSLREGRGTQEITEIQRVEEPPGSGIYVEKEVVVGEELIPFTKQDRLVLSTNPLITVFPDPPGGTQHRVEGEVDGSDPVHIFVDIPPEGAFPAAAINNRMNEQMQNTVFRNNGMTGVLEFLHGRGDSSLGASAETDFDSLGQNDMTQAITQTFVGENTTLGGRFITGAELQSMGEGLRHLVPRGTFGAFNQQDPEAVNQRMTALLGTNRADIMENLNRARPFINTGGAEAPSYEALYANMYPDDAARGYPRLRSIIGDSGMEQLDLNATT